MGVVDVVAAIGVQPVIGLYAGGMTIRDIQHLVSTISTDLSHETISKITDEAADEVLA